MKARVEWDGYSWVAVPETGGTTQARRLEQLPERLSEVAELMTGDTVDPDGWDLDIHYPDDPELDRAAAELRAMRAEIVASEAALAQRTTEVARRLREHGLNLRDIGTMTGVSYQRAHQITKR